MPNLSAKSLAVDHRLQPIRDHFQRFLPRAALRSGFEQRNLGNPETTIANHCAFEPHDRTVILSERVGAGVGAKDRRTKPGADPRASRTSFDPPRTHPPLAQDDTNTNLDSNH